ncbi:MAG: DUF434 domain-containing protein [Sedimentisphaerales bacterium]|jgi:hypothetical protein
MPDKRAHRGQHPADEKLFSETWIPNIRRAVADYSLLLSKGYAEKSSLKLVGDRFTLTERQRLAVMRSACSDEQQAGRKSRQLDINAVAGQMIAIDGYNLLITIEAAMSGGLIFRGRDGCCRDLASIHGTYRRVSETQPAIELIGGFLQQIGISQALWLLDSPVSNSGRLKTLLRELAEKNKWNGFGSFDKLRAGKLTAGWEIELVTSPDAVLIKGEKIVASSDSVVLDKCGKWVDLAGEIIKKRIPTAKIIDLETQP